MADDRPNHGSDCGELDESDTKGRIRPSLGPTGPRPTRLVVVAGTGTEVGKTWVARRLLEALRARGTTVAARKPVQSFEPGDTTTDADELAAATGEDPLVVCPAHRRHEVAMAPPMAADALGRPPIRLADLVDELAASWGPRTPPSSPPVDVGPVDVGLVDVGPVDVGLVELAGGVRSPLAHDGDGIDLIGALLPDSLVVVADAGLGTINAVLTTLDSLGPLLRTGSVAPVIVHLNRYDDSVDLHRRNRDFLDHHLGRPTTTSIAALAAALVAGPAPPG